MRFSLRIPLILACLAPVGCAIQTQGQIDTAADVEPTLYYYGGPHFYPESLGGDWCPIAEPHAHDFPPDHPEFYAYDSGYYYYAGRPGEVYVMGSVPIGVRIHEAREREPHRVYALPAQAPPAPHLAGGRWPTREAHPAPSRPPPPQYVGARRGEPRVDRRPDEPHAAQPETRVDPRRADDHRFQEQGHPAEERRVDARPQPQPQMQQQPQTPPQAQARPGPGPNEAHRAPPPQAKRKKDDKK